MDGTQQEAHVLMVQNQLMDQLSVQMIKYLELKNEEELRLNKNMSLQYLEMSPSPCHLV